MTDISRELAGLTDRVIAYRVIRRMGMALEIKGLKGKAVKAGAMFDRLNVAYDKLIETGEAHAADVESLPAQIEGMQDDLTFMVQTLGNSVSGSGQQQEQKQPETPKFEIKPGMTPEQTKQMLEQTGSPAVEPQPGFQPNVQLRPDPGGVQGQPVPAVQSDTAAPRPPQAVLDQAVIVDHLIGEQAAG